VDAEWLHLPQRKELQDKQIEMTMQQNAALTLRWTVAQQHVTGSEEHMVLSAAGGCPSVL
jgi:hypothetical protein